MGMTSIWHWLLVLAVVLVLFGGSGKISSLMGDVAKGIKSFKKGMSEEPDDAADDGEDVKVIDHEAKETAKAVKARAKSSAKS